MAPTGDTSSAPLADWFFISGVDGEQLRWSEEDERASWPPQAPIEPTIEEEKTSEDEGDGSLPRLSLPPRSTARSPQPRLSRHSDDMRLSMQSVRLVDSGGTESNRSSTTIKAEHANGGSSPMEATMDDFERALRHFTSERDTFLSDLVVSAGAVTKAKPRARTQRVGTEEMLAPKSTVGSIRRRISFRDMSSMKRQPSMVARNASVRTSRRMSNYNSVIPSPRPLNVDPNMHPLKRRFEPVLLDRYPLKGMTDEVQRRPPFPDYVPMFAFPNDITVVSCDERPRCTWHGFAMTTADNSRLYGICVLVWMPLNHKASAELERRCDQWRRKNMSDEERELASSLSERLVTERAHLSELLARLPAVAPDSSEREKLEDEISAVEEKISLMTDLLRPVRHGAASKIDGLTDGETGFWVPRAYGILGKDASLTTFWKDWLRAVVVPMMNNSILRVPPSSPKVGMWQPIERYVVNLCAEALSPVSSKIQVDISVRELHLFARKEAINELPGARNTDLYPLFRALSIPNIVVLFEFLLSESRIILLSSHTAMLHLISKALVELIYPFTWSGVFIPVLPSRLVGAIEAPCPYIIGLERRYEDVDLPTDDFVLVDLDSDTIESTIAPAPMPKQQRRKLTSLLQVAAPHHYNYGVVPGPPAYAIESFPFDAFSAEIPAVYNANPFSTGLSKYAGLSSSDFGGNSSDFAPRKPILNAFLMARDQKLGDRPGTTATLKESPPPSLSPSSPSFPAGGGLPRNDSGYSLQATLREKRSGHFEGFSRRSSSFTKDHRPTLRRPSAPFASSNPGHPPGHSSNPSISTISTDGFGSSYAPSMYAPSSYAQSTLAASTIMPQALTKSVRDTDTTKWVEGHNMIWRAKEDGSCAVCDEKADEGFYRCTGCGTAVHGRCAPHIVVVCDAAFHPDQIRAAFVRCFASLFYTYRKFMKAASGDKKKNGQHFVFDSAGFVKSLPRETAEYVQMLQQTQGFNEFLHEREMKPANDPSIVLFDQVIGAKKNRSRTSFFGKATTSFLSDTSDHLWRTANTNPPTGRFPGDYREVVTRVPAKLDHAYLMEPRMIRGMPRITHGKTRRKPIPSMLGMSGLASSPPGT